MPKPKASAKGYKRIPKPVAGCEGLAYKWNDKLKRWFWADCSAHMKSKGITCPSALIRERKVIKKKKKKVVKKKRANNSR